MENGLSHQSPATFQTFITEVLSDLVDVICVIYLDDILIFSRTLEEHEDAVRRVLQRLRDHHLFANVKKCKFDKSSVEYLGYIVCSEGVSMNPKKIARVASPLFCQRRPVLLRIH